MFSFAWPWCFLLLPLPLIIFSLCKPAEKKQTAVYVPFYDSLNQETNTQQLVAFKRVWMLVALIVIWCLLVTATARPQWVGESVALPLSGRDLLLAVDISESMNQQDMMLDNEVATRLAVVKNVLADFIERRRGDRLGLVLFGTNAYLQAPLTFDTNTVATFINEAQLGFAGSKTAIGEAIGLSVKRLQALQKTATTDNERVIVLLTDGANTAGEISPVQAAQLAEQLNIKIYTIGIGAEEMIVGGFFGPRRINPSAQLDEVTLRAIASTTDADYFRATNTEELNQIYQKIDALEPIEQDAQLFRPTRSLYTWPLAMAFLLSLFVSLLRIRKPNTHIKKEFVE